MKYSRDVRMRHQKKLNTGNKKKTIITYEQKISSRKNSMETVSSTDKLFSNQITVILLTTKIT